MDLSNKELLIPVGIYNDMEKRVKNFIVKEKRNPAIVYLKTNQKEWVTFSRYQDMEKRVNTWKKTSKEVLYNVWIKKPSAPLTNINPTADWKKNTHIKNVIKVVGDFNTGTQLVEKIRAYAKSKKGLYKYYLNSRFLGTNEEIKALTNGSMGNCVDWSQLLRALLLIMGYTVDFINIQCTVVTHVLVRVIGMEWTKQTYIDLAAIVDWHSAYCAIGNVCWCSTNGKPNKIVGINNHWLFE